MKNLPFLILSLATINLFGQPSKRDTTPIEWNFYEQKELKINEISRKSDRDSLHDDDYTKYKRWEYFWMDRVPASGDLREYATKIDKHYKTNATFKTNSGDCSADCEFSCFQSDWKFLGPEYLSNQTLGKINSLWINPSNSNEILAGADGGLWKTINGGSNWINLTDFCLPSIGIYHIEVQPNNHDIIYISTGITTGGVQSSDHEFGYGVFKTTDGGLNWSKLNINPSLHISKSISHKVLIHPVNFNNVYSIVGSGVYKSINSGATWTQIMTSAQNQYELALKDLEIKSDGLTDKIYVSSQSKIKDYNCSNTNELYCTCVGSYCDTRYTAKVWEFESDLNTLNSSNFIDLSLSISGFHSTTSLSSISITPNSVNIACMRENGITIIKNSGSGWNIVSNLNLSGFNPGTFPFEVSSNNENIMYLGGYIIKKSTNGGTSFQNKWNYWDMIYNPSTFSGSHPDVRCLYIYNSNSSGNDVLFFGTDGGVSKSSDGANTTLNLNGENLQLTQLYGISNSEILPNLIYSGAQDNGAFDNFGSYWRVNVNTVGDAYDAVVDVTNPEVGYITSGGGFGFGPIRKTSNGGASWSYFGCPTGENCQNKPLFVDNNNNLYVGSKHLWRRNGSSWQQITNINTGGREIRAIAITDDGNIGYIGYTDIFWGATPTNRVFKITNLNSTPTITDITAGLDAYKWATLTDLAVEPSDGDKVWATFGNLWDGHKVFSFNSNTNIWTNISQGLPDIPVNAIEYLKNSNDLLFAGTDDGVYYIKSGMSEWKRFSCELPHTIVSDLEINYKLNRLRAATFGRGIWETPIPKLYEPECIVNPNISVSINKIPFGGFVNTTMTDGQTRIINSKNASVKIHYKGICVGGDCCTNNQSAIMWEIFRKDLRFGNEQLYNSGTSSIISFSGIFRSGWFFFTKRYQYRVVINHNCGGNECGKFELTFRG